ncbi:TonB-dependent receptor domain-containing protein [Sphingomonas echinoides]|uniref:TonB-dependent receptor n=1 Tax=Sphingomonas echinoides TaxID=59803 RepID=A0ABU4PJE5_9SPHN|nr:TonB-dependent receptor [Sphingomonas echinoides]MDX5983957.1 TonB-dependent receptor [Sphingomonas echinoides]
MKSYGLLSATAIASAMLAIGAPAWAQTSTPAESASLSTSPTETDKSDDSNDILVTGSHIRSIYKGADPVITIRREDAVANGFSTTTDLLQSNAITNGTSQINNAYGGYVTNGGPGANTISLRGLGPSRTLLLLNGRRLAPSGSRGAVGSVDLNTLPSAMVDRIEVLNAGSSSIYGSDAVAGVINVITRKFKGLELDGEVNVPGVGAGVQKRLAAVFGAGNDDFSINGSIEYYKRNALAYADRDFSQCQIGYRNDGKGGGPGTGDFIDPKTGKSKCYGIANGTGDSGVTINTIGLPGVLGGTVALAPGVPAGYNGTCNRFRPNPLVTTGAYPGYECVGGGSISLNVRDTFAPSLLNQPLISGTENYNGFLSGTYNLHALGDAELYGELLVSRRDSSQLGQRQFTIDYNQGSLLLPTALRNGNFGSCVQASFPTCITGTPVAARVFANYGNYNNYQTSDYVKFGGGIRGNLPYKFHYDLYASQSWSDARYTTDLILTNRLAQSLDVVASGSGFACRNPVGGCVAAPALTSDVIGGVFPQAWLNYVVAPVTGTTKFRETTFAANFDGPLFDLPGGTAQIALGAEHRSQNIDDTPSTESQNGNLYGFTSSTITRGSDSVTEGYGELELPLLHNQLIHDLTVTASGRYTSYRSYGGNFTYKFGGLISPVEWFSVRGSYGTSFRAPQLFEQYLGATSGFQAAQNDICGNLTANSLPNRIKNCAADGVPLGFTPTNGIQVNQRGGAASGLASENSRNINVGGVFNPKFAGGSFSLSVDYFDIKVSNGVSQLSYSTILSQCYDSVEFRANSVCNLVVRGSTAPYPLTVTTGYVNIATSVVRGIDYNARFTHDLAGGKVLLNAKVTQFLSMYDQNLPTDPIVDQVGFVRQPRFTGVFDATYALKGFSVHYSGEWTQHTSSDTYVTGNDPTYNFNTPDYWLHSLSVAYKAPKYEMTVGVRNLTDKNPPSISAGYYNRVGNAPLYSGYDFVGRTFFVSVTTKF